MLNEQTINKTYNTLAEQEAESRKAKERLDLAEIEIKRINALLRLAEVVGKVPVEADRRIPF